MCFYYSLVGAHWRARILSLTNPFRFVFKSQLLFVIYKSLNHFMGSDAFPNLFYSSRSEPLRFTHTNDRVPRRGRQKATIGKPSPATTCRGERYCMEHKGFFWCFAYRSQCNVCFIIGCVPPIPFNAFGCTRVYRGPCSTIHESTKNGHDQIQADKRCFCWPNTNDPIRYKLCNNKWLVYYDDNSFNCLTTTNQIKSNQLWQSMWYGVSVWCAMVTTVCSPSEKLPFGRLKPHMRAK